MKWLLKPLSEETLFMTQVMKLNFVADCFKTFFYQKYFYFYCLNYLPRLKNVFIILLLFPVISFAQVTENFDDGDFTNNPTWIGDASQFMVNGSQQLQLNSTGINTSYLSVGNNSASLANTTWQFYIQLAFAPSSSNYARVYLVSDQSNLEGSLNGYYLQFGEANSNDAIELFKQTGTPSTSVARGTNGFIANPFTISVQVTRDNAGNWNILADPTAGTNFVSQATGNDITYNTSSYFGVVCNYTSSNATNFFFDNFVFPYTPDVTPPAVSSINVISVNEIDVIFNEPVEQFSAETTSNYSVNNSIGNPNAASLTSANTVHLTFGSNFSNGVLNTLSVINVKDISNNPIATPSTGQFTYFAPVTPSKYDMVINEIFPDESPQIGLPPAEYVEIYNRSTKTFDLNGWKFSDSGTPQNLPSFILTPGSFLILCSSSNASLFSSFGNVLGLTSFPSLNNDGDDLKLYDVNSNIIDQIVYDPTLYHDVSKQDGGWSIERINPDFTCTNPLNWKASINSNGGTPGSINSVDGDFSDTQSPSLLRALVIDATHVKVFFDEAMNAATLSNTSTYSIDNGIGTPSAVSVQPDFTAAALTVTTNIVHGIIYKLAVTNSISDCAGNILSGTDSVRFAIPDSAEASDIIINEILFNPLPEYNYDFVELYNRSDKIIDLGSLRIASINSVDNSIIDIQVISSEGYLIFPGDYVALTESPETIKNHYATTNPGGFLKVETMPAFNDDEDAVVITNSSLFRMDQFNYSEKYHFPLINDPEGISLERISFNRPTQDSSNWHSAAETVGFATPAYENSQHAEVVDDGSEVSVEPEVFSPDNDGNDDVVNINYHFGEPGYTANLKIFDAKGRLIIQLIKNELLGIEGAFTWNGITDDNLKAKVGIYVIYLEVFNETGTVKKFKKPLVLASRL
jgi:hypothetical protein